MKTAKLNKGVVYSDLNPTISVLFETETTKEIRILMKKGQMMKKHHTPFPFTVMLFSGSLDFGVNEEKYRLEKGDFLALEGSVPHSLVAIEDCIIRLTLSKFDEVKRVQDVLKQ